MIHDIFSKTPLPKKKEISASPILIDYRENNSLVPTFLRKQNLQIIIQELKVGDYLINDTIIERKSVKDFASSMINKRLFNQLEEIKQYPNFLLIIEGNLHKINGIHPNAIRGFVLSIALRFKVPMIFTHDEEETAIYLSLLAKKQNKTFALNPSKNKLSPNDQKLFILQSFPEIGPIKSKQLLEKFRTLKKTFNASEKELEEILGNKQRLTQILNGVYFSPGTNAKKL